MTADSSIPPDSCFRGALLGLACGDALGAPVEFLPRAVIKEGYGRLTEMVGGGSFGWAPGEWTDDTGMALCVAEGILARPDDPVQQVGTRFLDWAATAKDVGGTIAAALAKAGSQLQGGHAPIDWAEASRTTPQARSGKAAGNGSLMRTLPVALAYPDVGKMLDVSASISAMTHWDPQAEVCCALYCFWVKEILAGSRPRAAWESALELARDAVGEGRRSPDTPGPDPVPGHFWDRLEDAPGLDRDDLQPTGYAGYVVHCLEAAVWAAVNADNPEEALVGLVNLGGETDTMAAVAGGAVGARFGLQAIPTRWLEVLHQRSRLERVARDLFELRHQRVYETPNLPAFWILELEERLLYGRNPLTARDVEKLITKGVTRALDLREDHEWNRPDRYGREAVAALERSGVVRESVPIKDTTAPRPEQLDRTRQILSNARADRDTVFVHCRGGIERTGTVIAAYLARRDVLPVDETLRGFDECDSRLHPLSHQIEAVRRWLRSRD
jgi:ADP-ribosyl-[dinitrogen reductase] hydrolase